MRPFGCLLRFVSGLYDEYDLDDAETWLMSHSPERPPILYTYRNTDAPNSTVEMFFFFQCPF